MNVLLISYNKLFLRSLNYLCLTERYSALSAETAETAFSALGAQTFDIVVIGSDIVTNEQHEFANAAKQNRNTAVLLLYEGSFNPEILADAVVDVMSGTEEIRSALRRLQPEGRRPPPTV